MLKRRTVGIDATALEANAALRSIVNQDSGVPTPTRTELARLGRKPPKKGSNDDRAHAQDPDARIAKMTNDHTRLARKAEHALHLATAAGFRVHDADDTTMVETLITATEHVQAVLPADDKGYHSNATAL